MAKRTAVPRGLSFDGPSRLRETFDLVDWDRVVTRFDAGETKRLVCDGRDGMPTDRQYRLYLAADQAFAERVSAIFKRRRREGAMARQVRTDEVTAVRRDLTRDYQCVPLEGPAEVDAYLAGDSVRCLLCGQDGFNGLALHLRLKHQAHVNDYRAAFNIPASRPLLTLASRARRVSSGENETSRATAEDARRSRAAVDWNAALARMVDGGTFETVCTGRNDMPTQRQWNLRRASDAPFAAQIRSRLQGRGGIAVTEDRILAFVDKAAAQPIYRAAAQVGASQSALRRAVLRRPELAAQFLAGLAARRTRGRKAISTPAHLHREARQRALMDVDVYAAVNRAVARVDPTVRDELRSMIVVDVYEGALHPADVAAAIGFYIGELRGRGVERQAVSLDAPLIDDSRRTLGDAYTDASLFDVGEMADLGAGWA